MIWRIFFSEREFVVFPHCGTIHFLWKSWKFTLTPFWQKIRESNVFTTPVYYGNSGNSLSHLFDKKFVKITFLLKKKLLKRLFHEFFFRWERISRFSTVCALKKLLKSWLHEIFFQWLLSFSLISCGITLLKENLQKSPVAFMSLSFGCLFFACRFMRRITFCFCCFLLFILELYIKRQSFRV